MLVKRGTTSARTNIIFPFVVLLALVTLFGNRGVFPNEESSPAIVVESSPSIVAPREPVVYTNYDDSLPTFVIVCGTGETDAIQEMDPLLKSTVLLSSRPVRWIFLSDDEGSKRLRTLFGSIRTDKVASVEIYSISVEDILAWCRRIQFRITHHSGHWGALKLFTPWLLPQHDRFIVLDTDMVFVADPARLWDEFEHNPDGHTDWLYKLDLTDTSSVTSICSCIVLLHARAIRERAIFPDVMQQTIQHQTQWKVAGTNEFDVPKGDQGLYFAMMQRDASQFASVHPMWNKDLCHRYGDAYTGGQAGILHQNCDKGFLRHFKPERQKAKTLLQSYDVFPWSWIHQPDRPIPIDIKAGKGTFPDIAGL